MIRAWMEDLWRRKSTSILTGIGISGMAGATIWAVAATPKAMKRIAKKKEELEKNKLNPWETAKEVWDIYILPAGLEILSAGCIVFAHVKDERRIATRLPRQPCPRRHTRSIARRLRMFSAKRKRSRSRTRSTRTRPRKWTLRR